MPVSRVACRILRSRLATVWSGLQDACVDRPDADAVHRLRVATRRGLFPDAAAEDMEGFAVALACRLAGVPLSIVRGISNTAGDRDPARWLVPEAVAAAAALAARILEPPR